MSRMRILIATLSFVLCASPTLGDDVVDSVKAIASEVEDISIGGSWQDGDRGGAYRLVVTRSGGEKTATRLFVQWIEYTETGATVAETTEITEFAELSLDIMSLSSESEADGLSVFIETINDSGDLGDTYELHVFSPREYRFGPASN